MPDQLIEESAMNHNSPQRDIGAAYLLSCRRRMMEEYLPRVTRCVDELSEDDIWWRAHETDNTVGNLLLHLSGNIRQWIICGLGGATDVRHRTQEFAHRERIPKPDLLRMFATTVQEADSVLASFDVSKLMEVRHIQEWNVTCLDALSHVIEHMAQHLGQIIFITKLRKGIDLRFYNL